MKLKVPTENVCIQQGNIKILVFLLILINGCRKQSAYRSEGWVEKVHRKGKFMFVHLKDGLTNGSVQVVLPKAICKTVSFGSAVEVCGSWLKSEGPQQNMELLAAAFNVVGPNYSGKLYDKSSCKLRETLHLRPKSSAFASVLKFRSRLSAITHHFFMNEGFIHADPPVISVNDCEGAGETFSVDTDVEDNFFDQAEVFLPVSSQLHLEAFVSGIPKVYTIGSAFRAEKSRSRQHLAEFRMLEAEFGFAYKLDQVCDLVEKYIHEVVKLLSDDSDLMSQYDQIRSSFGEEGIVNSLLCSVLKTEFPRLTYTEAERLLRTKGELVHQNGFSKQQEFLLVEYCKSPVFVTHFPSAGRPFYMSRTANGNYAECFDFLCGLVGELAGGSLRETDPDKLRSRGCGSSLDWYIQLRENGQPPSGGFGLGIERFLQCLLGIANIKDTVAFPRWWKHCHC